MKNKGNKYIYYTTLLFFVSHNLLIADNIKNQGSKITEGKLNEYYKLDEYQMRHNTIVQPVTFSQKSAVFINPDTTSQVVHNIDFNTSIEPITDEYIDGWIKIQLENKIGYIQESDVALYSFFTHFKAPKSKYFIKDGSIYKFHLM